MIKHCLTGLTYKRCDAVGFYLGAVHNQQVIEIYINPQVVVSENITVT